MQRGQSQHSRRLQSKIKNTFERHRPNKSKSKHLPDSNMPSNQYSRNITLTTSPNVTKHTEQDKQNAELTHSILRVLAAAAEGKQKQILNNLILLMQKQRKMKVYVSNKQTIGEKQQLQAMIQHIKNEETKELGSLKIQIGKKKLQSLDEHDIRQDIINLNSYVMRRSKKQSIAIKAKGVDLIGQIYGKFDEQSSLIKQFVVNEKLGKSNAIKQKELNRGTEKKPKQQLNSSVIEQECPLPNKIEQKQKIEGLQKQNLRLLRQISKIEQQFQCVVEEKLILEQRIQRMQNKKSNQNKIMSKLISNLKNEGSELKQFYQQMKEQIFQYFHQFHKSIQNEINTIWMRKGHEKERNESECSPGSNYQSLKESEGDSQLIEKYETILTEKQFEINSLLKTISKINREKQMLEGEKNDLAHSMEKSRANQIKIRDQLKQVNILSGKIKIEKDEIMNQVIQLRQFLGQSKWGQNLQNKITGFTQHQQSQRNSLQGIIEEKQIRVNNQDQRIVQLQQQIENLKTVKQNDIEQSKKQNRRLLECISHLQNAMKFQRGVAQESISNLKSQLDEMNEEKRRSLQQTHKGTLYLEEKVAELEAELLQAMGLKQEILLSFNQLKQTKQLQFEAQKNQKQKLLVLLKEKQRIIQSAIQKEKEVKTELIYQFEAQMTAAKEQYMEMVRNAEKELQNQQRLMMENLEEQKQNIYREKNKIVQELEHKLELRLGECQKMGQENENLRREKDQQLYTIHLMKKQLELKEEEANYLKGETLRISEVEKQKQEVQRRQKQKEEKIQVLSSQLEQYAEQINTLRIGHSSSLKIINEQQESQKNIIIEQCGMLLQRKTNQILQVRLEVDRQKIINEDLISIIRQRYCFFQNQYKTLRSKIQSLPKIRQDIQILKNNLLQVLQALSKQKMLLSSFVEENQYKFHQTFSNLKQPKRLSSFSQVFQQIISSGGQAPSFYSLLQQILPFFQETKVISKRQWETKTFSEKIQCLKNYIKMIILQRQQLREMKTQGSLQYKIQRTEVPFINGEDKPFQIQSKEDNIHSSDPPDDQFSQDEPLDKEQRLDLTDIINLSGIVDEVEAIRMELAQAWKKNETLQKQLKIYQQRDIQNIFDF